MGDETEQERDRIAGPVIVRNVHDSRRVWPDLSTLSGHTLELGPGEEDTLPADPGDVAYLHIRKVPKNTSAKSGTDENTGG